MGMFEQVVRRNQGHLTVLFLLLSVSFVWRHEPRIGFYVMYPVVVLSTISLLAADFFNHRRFVLGWMLTALGAGYLFSFLPGMF